MNNPRWDPRWDLIKSKVEAFVANGVRQSTRFSTGPIVWDSVDLSIVDTLYDFIYQPLLTIEEHE